MLNCCTVVREVVFRLRSEAYIGQREGLSVWDVSTSYALRLRYIPEKIPEGAASNDRSKKTDIIYSLIKNALSQFSWDFENCQGDYPLQTDYP
jgi:hypothetical protein